MPICQFVACDKEIPDGRKFCSTRCVNLNRWGRTSFEPWSKMETCVVCGEEFETTRTHRRGFKTCSKACSSELRAQVRRGKTVSAETRQKLSKVHTGKKLSREHRRKIGLGVRGPRNRQWIDGRSYEKEGDADYNFEFTRVLKEEVRERDENQCRKCGATEEDAQLCVHHIDMDKHNNEKDNLVTLCFSCHSKIHNGTLENKF